MWRNSQWVVRTLFAASAISATTCCCSFSLSVSETLSHRFPAAFSNLDMRCRLPRVGATNDWNAPQFMIVLRFRCFNSADFLFYKIECHGKRAIWFQQQNRLSRTYKFQNVVRSIIILSIRDSQVQRCEWTYGICEYAWMVPVVITDKSNLSLFD